MLAVDWGWWWVKLLYHRTTWLRESATPEELSGPLCTGLSSPNNEDGRGEQQPHASKTNLGDMIPPPPEESVGLCDCKHHRHGLCLGRETSPVKKGSGLACAKPSEKMDLD